VRSEHARRLPTGSKARFKRVTDRVLDMSSRASEADLSEDELRGLELIRETGGIHQSRFWKELEVSSRKGSRIVDTLNEYELIEREQSVYEGHNTYYLKPTAQDLDFSLLMAGDQLSPFVGDEDADPHSDAFSQWVMNLAYEE
jgi:hypothetical protein